jgi:hypothetical protein
MARLIMWNLMTLDGFVEGPNRESDHPGGGAPLFKPGERTRLKLLDGRALSTGIVIPRYAPN